MATKKHIPVRLPKQCPEIDQWLILSLDPSLTRTGYALMTATREGEVLSSKWIDVGSVAPDDSGVPVWIRTKALALAILKRLEDHELEFPSKHTGLLLVVEHPTPREDRLVTLNRVLHVTLFGSGIHERFAEVRILSLNASTLRSLMALKATGAKNKEENKKKAYTFIDEVMYPNLDTDSCDAVLLGVMGKHVASLLFGLIDLVPPLFLTRLCDESQITKGKGRNMHTITNGVLHQSTYWYGYQPSTCTLSLRDAKSRKRVLERISFEV